MNSIPQTAATTFAFSSVCFFSMMLACLWHLNQKPICFTNRADLLRVMTGGGCEIKINVCSRARMRRSDKIHMCAEDLCSRGKARKRGRQDLFFQLWQARKKRWQDLYMYGGGRLGWKLRPNTYFLAGG